MSNTKQSLNPGFSIITVINVLVLVGGGKVGFGGVEIGAKLTLEPTSDLMVFHATPSAHVENLALGKHPHLLAKGPADFIQGAVFPVACGYIGTAEDAVPRGSFCWLILP